MPIWTSGKSSFTPAPEGTDQAVCCDVVDLGMVETTYQDQKRMKHKIRLVWELKTTNPETGKPFMASRSFTNSIHENSALRPFLEQWRGKAFSESEIERFDVETLIGANGLLTTLHKPKQGGGKYANVTGVTKILPGMQKMMISDGYVRQCDRPDWKPPHMGETEPESQELPPAEVPYAADDSDIPF